MLEKRYDKRVEKKLQKDWQRENLYSFNKKSRRIFSIDTPPPYPSGRPWHIGAAAHYSQIDMIARTARMQGEDVYFPIGIDRNGLPVELYTETKYKVKLQETARERFIELCSHALDDLEREMLQIMQNMGMSCNFTEHYRTDSAEYRALTQATFIELWNRNLVYEATRPSNYCIDCGTTIADAEIAYEELPTELVYVKFKVKETDGDITIATTRPELLCSCQILMVNPADARHKNLVGKHAIVPIYNKEVKIIAHPYAKPEFGTGIVMMCSYGDYADVRFFRELKLREIIAIDPNGRMNKEAGKYAGLSVKEARKAITKDLEDAGIVKKKEKIMHRTPICERSKTPIEIISMKEYYLKQLQFLPKIKEFAKKMIFLPVQHRQILLNWISSVNMDWPISRRRYYGTEIPIWYCKRCGKANLPKQGTYWQPWKQKAPFKKCASCSSSADFVGDKRTFDTWMDSSISPLFISKYKKDGEFFKKVFPNTIRPQGKEIIRTWLYYTLLRCYQLTKKCAFKHAWIMGWGVDEKGERMSKSKGNVIDPIPLLERYGGDAFRLWAASEASLGSDFRCSETRIEGASKFLIKLWNVARFISGFKHKTKANLAVLDKWIILELNKLIAECLKGYKDFNFFIPANAVRNFVWNIFAPYYIELAKTRAYSKDNSALYTLHECLKTVLILLAPIAPFMADHIYREVYKKSVHKQRFPKIRKKFKVSFKTQDVIGLNSKIWKMKKEKGVSLRSEIDNLAIPKRLKCIEQDIKSAHNIKKIVWC